MINNRTKVYISEVMETIAGQVVGLLAAMPLAEKIAFLHDTSTKQLKRIFSLSTQKGDAETCALIEKLVAERGDSFT